MPLVPAVPKELRKEEKAQDRVQLHLPSAARLPVGVGQSFCLSRVNSHRAKSRGAGATVLVVSDGLGTSDSACSEGSRPECCWAQELSQQDWAALAVFIPWQINWLELGMGFFLLTCSDGVVCVPLFPQVITVWMLLFIRISYFNIHLRARLEKAAKNLRLSQSSQ